MQYIRPYILSRPCSGLVPNAYYSEAYSEQCQTSKMEDFEKIVEGFELLTIFAKCSILNVWQGSDYVSAADNHLSLGKEPMQ